MDSMHVIGYRIDVYDDFDYDIVDEIEQRGLSLDGFPGSEWMYWPSVEQGITSLWMMKGDKRLVADYRCPVTDLCEDMYHKPFDVPDTFVEYIFNIQQTLMFKWLEEKFGKDKVKVKWGVAYLAG